MCTVLRRVVQAYSAFANVHIPNKIRHLRIIYEKVQDMVTPIKLVTTTVACSISWFLQFASCWVYRRVRLAGRCVCWALQFNLMGQQMSKISSSVGLGVSQLRWHDESPQKVQTATTKAQCTAPVQGQDRNTTQIQSTHNCTLSL